jgi:hypothetical protein
VCHSTRYTHAVNPGADGSPGMYIDALGAEVAGAVGSQTMSNQTARLIPPGQYTGSFRVWMEIIVSTGKRSEHPRGKTLTTHM